MAVGWSGLRPVAVGWSLVTGARRPRRRRRLRDTPSRSNRSAADATSSPLELQRDRRRPAASAGPPARPDRRRRTPRAAVDEQPAEALPAQRLDGRGHGAAVADVAVPGPRRSGGAGAILGWPRRRSLQLVDFVGSSASCRRVERRRVDDRQVEADAAGACPPAARPAGAPRPRPSRARLRARTCGRTSGRRARTAAACSRESRSSCRRSSADCGCCSSGGWRSPARCRRCDRRRASPSARGTAGRRPTAIRRSAAALRRRSCRRRATTCPTR